MSAFSAILDQCSTPVKIGSGGQKTVFRARHNIFGDVVVKRGRYASASTLERIRREVSHLRDSDSRYFPRSYDFLIDEANREFLILEEYISGSPLSKVTDQFRTELQLVHLGKEIVVAMHSTWDRNVVHRDLKPDNILISPDGFPKIIDFGIARFLDETSLTRTVAASGPATPRYAAPEQLLNLKESIGPRTDFFSIGIILAELALQYHPFDPSKVGNSNSISENIVLDQKIDLSTNLNFSPSFVTLLQKLLKPQPFQRFRTSDLMTQYFDSNWR